MIAAALTAEAASVVASKFELILSVLRAGTGHDFTQYKKQTLMRRIERRMAQHLLTDIADYARLLQQQPAEVKALFRELLINVTSFFRDPEAWDVLKAEILPPMLKGRADDLPLRVWVAGCSSGEEAYSIAMVLRELMDEAHPLLRVQLYATDLDDEAIAAARTGLYPVNIAQDVSEKRLLRFFVPDPEGYRIKKEIREMVIFAVQNIVQDPPFTRLDLLSCRNVMIYLEPELQHRLLPALHYALKPGGVLWLSPAESVGSHTELFEPAHRKWNFFRARGSLGVSRSMLGSGLRWTTDASLPGQRLSAPVREFSSLAEAARRALLQSFAPPSVLTDLRGEVLYVHGETGDFLRLAPGQPSRNVLEMAREGLEAPLREALRQAESQTLPCVDQRVMQPQDPSRPWLDLRLRLLHDEPGGQRLLLLSFCVCATTAGAPAAGQPRRRAKAVPQQVAELEIELDHLRLRLKSALDEQQASNEELKSFNEELQSTNEELQSTNEELETSKEELQSVNEELVTVNAELQTKIEQMVGMQDDMKNLLDNIRTGTIFLDRKLMIRRYTREATRVFRLVPSDLGRALGDIRCDLQGGDAIADAQEVLDSLVPIERELSLADGTVFLGRTQPYRTVDNVIDGVVLTFTDVTERVHAMANRQARDLAEAVVDAVPEPLLVLDKGLKVVSVNRSFLREFGGTTAVLLGQSMFAINEGQWDFAEFRDLLETVLPRDQHFDSRRLQHTFVALGDRQLKLAAHRVSMPAQSGELVLLVIEVVAPRTPLP
jgi:two-component system CheB/CheR fusion protein